jgi:signal transduction histidine kinase
MHALIMGEWDALARNAARGMKQLRTLSGYYMTAYSQFFIAIARAIQLQGDVEHRASLLAELDASREWLAARAADQPYNFLHLLRLVEAERARAEGDSWRAMAAFDSALREAQGRDRPWHRAIITERAGLFHLAIGLEHTGRKLLADAHDQYEAWGAAAKVEQMRREHGFLHATQAHPEIASTSAGSSNSMSPDALDLMGVLRASQALSSETTVQRLTARVTEVLAAMTGATKVLLLSWHDDEWWLLGESPLPLANAAERGLLPLTAVRYAERTEQPMLVDDAPADDRFMREAYFASVPICSLLAVPIAGQGGARAMLLLENRLGRAAFNAQRLDAVMLIAGQLATSLANAQLYESLEQRVRARTEELERTQAELVATARRAGKAEIANNVLHNVGNVLNSVNVSASLVRRTLSQTRIEGLSRAVQLIAEHEHDLPDFVAKDPRGQALRAYLTEVTKALRSERETAIADLDRLAGSIEHITHVVATQQSLAGPSSLLEMHRPQDLIEEALRMSAGVIEQCKVQVVRRFAELPPAALDQPRLLQILLNLIRNAAEAMERSPAGARCLTVSTRLERVGSDSRLHIEVQDTGEGISHDNLKRLFAHGFTTREGGHGFGLHSSASAALEMGGTLDARSEGPGQGAMFSLVLPFAGSP